MLPNRYTALIDACVLVDRLRRDVLMSLARAGLFRLRWSETILDEMEHTIEKLFLARGRANAADHARRARRAMERAFEEALVTGHQGCLPNDLVMPDPGDRHVLAAAVKTQAHVIVTENIIDFPSKLLEAFNLEVQSSDAFIADTITLDLSRSVAALRSMRERWSRPSFSASDLLRKMDAARLNETASALAPVAGLL